VLDEAADVLEPFAASRGGRLHVELPHRALLAWCDGTRVTQVLVKLGVIAIEAAPDGGDVHVRGWSSSAHVQLEVRPASGDDVSGARSVIEAHGGRLHVDQRPGKDSAFTVALPRRAPPRCAWVSAVHPQTAGRA
jgi:signal transduction histidine kinase